MYQETADTLIPDLAKHQRRLLAAGGIGLLVATAALARAAEQFYYSYLMAYMFVLGITLGCLAVGMIHQLTGGTWGIVIRAPLGAATRTLPVVTLLFAPVLAACRSSTSGPTLTLSPTTRRFSTSTST